MPIEYKKKLGVLFVATMTLILMGPLRAGSVTVEIEDDEDAMSTPAPESNPSMTKSPPAEMGDAGENKMARVRISEKIGFYYFLKAGYAVPDDSKVPTVGKVLGYKGDPNQFYTSDKVYLELSEGRTDIKPGDLLVVYRPWNRVNESHSGFSGWWIRNLAIAKVLAVENGKCRVEVKQSFHSVMAGDKVRLYDDEISRWKQAQIKKTLPNHPLKCFVALTDDHMNMAHQSEFVILTAGSKKGVVEGQTFQLRSTFFSEGSDLPVPQGLARVFYAGADSSMAQIVESDGPVKTGFEAVFQP